MVQSEVKLTIDQKIQQKIERSKKMFAKLTEMGITAHLNEETGEITGSIVTGKQIGRAHV